MSAKDKNFQLRYVGARFNGPRLPLTVLADLPAFRDLIVAFAKDKWRSNHADKKCLPKGFDKSIAFDLVALEDGSARPCMSWRRDVDQAALPGFPDELEEIVDGSFQQLAKLIDDAGKGSLPAALSPEHVRALNKLGSGLGADEKIEFPGSQDKDGNVVFLDSHRRKALITHVQETYLVRFETIGTLFGISLDGTVSINTEEHGKLDLKIDDVSRIRTEFDGNIGQRVQCALLIELDANDRCKRVNEVFELEVVDAIASDEVTRCLQRLEELRNLRLQWKDESICPPTGPALASAEKLLSERPGHAGLFSIFPNSEAGLVFEFETKGWDYSIEFAADGSVEIYGVEIIGPGELEATTFESPDSNFFIEFDSRFGS
jgi:hypothetical protein